MNKVLAQPRPVRPVPATAQLHFKASFIMGADDAVNDPWTTLVKATRSWISGHVSDNQGLGQRWYFIGGSWAKPPNNRTSVDTRSFGDSIIPSVPKYWAARFIHPCSEFQFRQWATDVGLTVLAARRFEVTVTNRHWILDGYVGPEPSNPVASSPRLVKHFLNLKGWTASAGGAELRDTPRILQIGDGKQFCEWLKARDRARPIVLINHADQSDGERTDARLIARLIAGNGHVAVVTSKEVAEELEYFIPRSHRCGEGMVRIYVPRLLFEDADARRHRYFTRQEIAEQGASAIQAIISSAVVRRGRFADADPWITTIEDVEARAHEVHFASLRQKVSQQFPAEFAEELFTELDRVQAKLETAERENSDLRLQLEELQEEATHAKSLIRYWQKEAKRLTAEKAQIESASRALHELDKWPMTLAELVELVSKLHPELFVFTERAKNAATEAEYFSEIDVAWEMFRGIAEVLIPLFFDSNRGAREIEEEFRSRTGFAVSMTETGSTKQQKRLAALRRTTYNDEDYDITPHVKYGNEKPRLLRVHFAVDRVNGRLIIGHVGDHLETFSTRKRK